MKKENFELGFVERGNDHIKENSKKSKEELGEEPEEKSNLSNDRDSEEEFKYPDKSEDTENKENKEENEESIIEKTEKNKNEHSKEKETPQEKIVETKKEIVNIGNEAENNEALETDNTNNEKKIEDYLFGDFPNSEFKNNKIILSEKEERDLEGKMKKIKKDDRFKLPAILRGTKIAAEYNTHLGNFSTHTRIAEVDGKKVFVVNSYPLSLIHRALDGLRNLVMGNKVYKVPNWRWKKTYEGRSNIPVIKNSEKNMVTMPYIENVNLGDLFRWSEDIKPPESLEWARDLDLHGKMEIVEKIVDKIKEMHNENKEWGEIISPNMIIDKNGKVIICDPENLYYKNTTSPERKALDLTTFSLSTIGALEASGDINENDFEKIIKTIFERYGDDKEIKNWVSEINKKKLNFVQKVFLISELQKLSILKRKHYYKLRDILSKINEI